MQRLLPEGAETTSRYFADGSAIDLLSGDELVLWHNHQHTIAPKIQHQGVDYIAAKLHYSLQRALRLGRGCNDDSPTMEPELEILGSLFAKCGIDANTSILLTAAVVASWVSDTLPQGMPLINIWGAPCSEEQTLFDLIFAVVRRPLAIAKLCITDLFALPEGLWPTVIVQHPTERLLDMLLAASGRDFQILRKDIVLSLRCSGIIRSRWPIPVPSLSVQICPAGLQDHRLTASELHEVDRFLRPRLLHYRLRHHQAIANCRLDMPGELTPLTRMLAMALGAAVQPVPGLQKRVLEALSGVDQQEKVVSSTTPRALVIEAILIAAHEGKPDIYFTEITELVAAISAGRGDPITLSGRAVGDIVQKHLGLPANRQAPGNRISFDNLVRSRIHELGRNFGVLSLLEPLSNCSACRREVNTAA